MSDDFWSLDDIQLSKAEKHYFISTSTRLKWIIYSFFSSSMLSCATLILLPLFSEIKQLPLKSYEPTFVGYTELLVLQSMTLISGTFSYCSVVALIMTFTKLTQLQFRLLKLHIESCFSSSYKQKLQPMVKTIVDHHNFLLG